MCCLSVVYPFSLTFVCLQFLLCCRNPMSYLDETHDSCSYTLALHLGMVRKVWCGNMPMRFFSLSSTESQKNNLNHPKRLSAPVIGERGVGHRHTRGCVLVETGTRDCEGVYSVTKATDIWGVIWFLP